MVAYDGLWCSVPQMSWISHLQNPRFQRVTDVVVSWHDQVHVVAEYGLFFGGRHNQKPTICKQNVCRISYAILYAHDLICSNMNNMNLWNLVMLV